MRAAIRVRGQLDRLAWVIAGGDIVGLALIALTIGWHWNGAVLPFIVAGFALSIWGRHRRAVLQARLAELLHG